MLEHFPCEAAKISYPWDTRMIPLAADWTGPVSADTRAQVTRRLSPIFIGTFKDSEARGGTLKYLYVMDMYQNGTRYTLYRHCSNSHGVLFRKIGVQVVINLSMKGHLLEAHMLSGYKALIACIIYSVRAAVTTAPHPFSFSSI